MKAIICEAYGPLENLKHIDRPEPTAGGDHVVVRAEAIGVNFADALLVQGLYQMKPETPFAPGMEVAGTVTAIGPDAKKVAVGDRVACLMPFGGYAEVVSVCESSVFTLGDDTDAAHACALLCAYGTAHHALRQRANLQPGETLAVFGAAGSTGIAAVQIGKAIGARVIAVCSSEEKRQAARDAGADEAVGYDDLKNNLKTMTDGRGVDVVFDPVGGDAFDAAVRAMARGGRLLVIGFASGTIPKFPVNLALVKEFSLVGVFWGNFTRFEPERFYANMAELLAWHRQGEIRPVIEGRYPLSRASDVLKRVQNRGAFGKIVLVPD